MVRYEFIKVKRALSVSRLYDVDYSLNPYIGCEHGCIYCYAPQYSPNKVRDKWSERILIKKNIHELLGRELAKIERATIYLSSITDPYQPIENKVKLTRRCLEVLLNFKNIHVSIQTKSSLILRDLNLIRNFDKIDVGVTLTCLNDELVKTLEPKASKLCDRILILEKLSGIGIETWIFMGPIIPLYTDSEDNIASIVEVASRTSSTLIYDKLRLKPLVVKRLQEHLNDVSKILKLAKDNAYWSRIFKIIRKYCEKYHVKCTYSLTSYGKF